MNFICGRAAVNSPPFSKGDVCVSRQRDSDGFSHWQFKVPCAVNPLPSLSPVGSSLLGREPTSVSFAIFRCRVFRVPSAAEPLTTVPLFQRGMSASADRGILMGSSHWQFKVPCAVNPLPSLSPVGSSLRGREPAVVPFSHYGVRVFRIPSAALPRDLNSLHSNLNSFLNPPRHSHFSGRSLDSS